jgi:L-fuculose-phosphate aldolase/L-ribulose-5-phosphate 4-epimerase
MSDEITRIKEDMIKAASRAYRTGLQTGNGGNLSARVPGTDTVIIKGSGFSFGECTQDNFVMVDLSGEVMGEGGKPSRELLTHLAVYRNRPGIHGIFHTHSPWSIAYADDADEIPLLTDHSRSKLGPIPVIRIEGHGTKVFAEAVDKLMRERPELGAFVQTGHGIFGLGKNIILAEHNAELIEETAQIAILVSLRRALSKK